MREIEIKKGYIYFYAKDPEAFKCVEAKEMMSIFEDEKGGLFQFYNHDMYNEPLLETNQAKA